MGEATWLEIASKTARQELKAYLANALAKETGIVKVPSDASDALHAPAAMPAWQWGASKVALHETPTGAAVLPKFPMSDKLLPRVDRWKRHLLTIGRFVAGRRFVGGVTAFLRDAIFWYFQSTDGRWNAESQRWDRYGVRSLDEWWVPPHLSKCNDGMSKRTFIRCKDRLVLLGLIEAQAHLWQGKTKLWIKPTEQLLRIVFEPGFWETVASSFGPVKTKQTPKTSKAKPRGLSARHAKLDAEHRALYRKAIGYELSGLTMEQRWDVWGKLTKPKMLAVNHVRKPFAPKGSPPIQVALREAYPVRACSSFLERCLGIPLHGVRTANSAPQMGSKCRFRHTFFLILALPNTDEYVQTKFNE